ncbi:response regulator [Ancylothrix sp. C2]|uniref:response regulator n=1 Tax=Ancylothrix sp. D3o TaxID=2953691 RepID=UPI0021BAED15|nr:response regulator [Ancylothrix sp. D3o]MCT7950168.1 response regulator [Ancylothrix sp. D3o]
MNILLVDDDYLLAKGTAKLIQRIGGHNVTISDEPAEIVKQCEAGTVDVVLMDVNLPGASWQGQEISGADLSRILKTRPPTAHIPIIMVTAYAMLTERQTLLALSQADEFCTKPITDYEFLLNLIERLTKKQSEQN